MSGSIQAAADGCLFSESLDAFRPRVARHARLFSREDPEDPCGCFYIFQDLVLAKYDISGGSSWMPVEGLAGYIIPLSHGLRASKI